VVYRLFGVGVDTATVRCSVCSVCQGDGGRERTTHLEGIEERFGGVLLFAFF
jgi:hypothetical protein